LKYGNNVRVTITAIKEMKRQGEKIPMLTAYDYITARIIDEAGVPLILVGDSLGMVVLGYASTVPVTMADMLHHTKAVARGTKKAMVISDMPFMSYRIDSADALRNARKFVQQGGAQAVKLEGGENISETVKKIVDCGIPVMGHIGLTPQSILHLGEYKVQGKTGEQARQLLRDARVLENAGVFALVLECIPAPLANLITQKISVPTIGIGAGPACDGQVQVVNDMLGLCLNHVPKHARQYAKLGGEIKTAINNYVKEIKSGTFPSAQESYIMDETLFKEIMTQ
jgi:3-methyl-2-oxobutanoate hydroxymethyltransferase